ncbi:MAG: antirestriction protein ArdA [Pseudomonadota bacterium]
MTNQSDSGIWIYAACLAAYNNGVLYGQWIDATQGVFAMQDAIAAMLAASPVPGAEERAIHDFEGFEGAPVDEWLGLDSVASLAEFIAEHGRLGGGLVGCLSCITEAREAIAERYVGCYASLADWAEELTEGQGDIPEHLAPYIDYERMARDLAISDVFTVETGLGEVHVFWSH